MHEIIDFHDPLPAHWHITEIGAGEVTQSDGALALHLPAQDKGRYHDAQLTDFSRRQDFRWRPPLRMEVTAYCSVPSVAAPDYPLVGTAGFGFWNHPYGLAGDRSPRLPKAVWFFFSGPPSNMQLAQGVSGPGWKAATIDTTRWQFLALAPTAPIGMLLMRHPTVYRRLWPIGQRAIGVSEKLLDARLLLERHTYRLDWLRDKVRFAVDGVMVHEALVAIGGSMGFIAWIDNQYAIVTPQGRLGAGVVAVEQSQSLILERVEISAGIF